MADNIESKLISRFKNGDISAFNVLTQVWYDKILSFLYRVLGRMDEAEDVCQNTFITAYLRLYQLNAAEKFSTWLYRIANNQAVDQIRLRKSLLEGKVKWQQDDIDESIEPPDSNYVDMESRIDGDALHGLFEKAMRSIPDEQRVVLVMKVYHDLKFSEIAEVLNIPVNTVKTRMYSGLRAMREALNKNKLIEELLKDAM